MQLAFICLQKEKLNTHACTWSEGQKEDVAKFYQLEKGGKGIQVFTVLLFYDFRISFRYFFSKIEQEECKEQTLSPRTAMRIN